MSIVTKILCGFKRTINAVGDKVGIDLSPLTKSAEEAEAEGKTSNDNSASQGETMAETKNSTEVGEFVENAERVSKAKVIAKFLIVLAFPAASTITTKYGITTSQLNEYVYAATYLVLCFMDPIQAAFKKKASK